MCWADTDVLLVKSHISLTNIVWQSTGGTMTLCNENTDPNEMEAQ